jgi:MFS family permease
LHRQYEALRAYFVDELPSKEVAERFGYAPGSFRVLCFALYITSTMALYFFKYDLNRTLAMDAGSLQFLLTVFLGAGGIFQIASMLLYPLLAKFFKRRQVFNLTIVLAIAGYIGFILTSFFLDNSLYVLFPVAMIVFIGFGFTNVLQTVLLSDTVEYGQWKIGHRSESIPAARRRQRLLSGRGSGHILFRGRVALNIRNLEAHQDKMHGFDGVHQPLG